MSQPVQKKFKTLLSLLPISSVSLKTPLFLSLCFSHPSLKLVSRQNRSPSPVLKRSGSHLVGNPPNPTVVFSLAPSLFSHRTSSLDRHPPHLTSLISPVLRGPSSHAGTAVPLSPLHRPISVPLAATGRLRDNIPQRIHRQGFLKGEEVRMVSDTCFWSVNLVGKLQNWMLGFMTVLFWGILMITLLCVCVLRLKFVLRLLLMTDFMVVSMFWNR